MKAHTYTSHSCDEQGYVKWTPTEDETWATLVNRQKEVIQGRACKQFFEGLDILDFPADKVPQIPYINEKLDKATGWGVAPVPAIIQPQEFFNLLANKRFPAATFIRIPEELDYLEEPDIFHEVYGHTPLLTNQAYADFMQEFGKLALKAQPKDRRKLFRLFWFTIEFGLIREDDKLKAYGGGILSSIGETQYCLTDQSEKVDFDLLTVLRTPYRIDIMQPLYFVINDLGCLFKILEQDILATLEQAKELGDLPAKYPSKEENPGDSNLKKTDDEFGMGGMKC